MSKIYFQLVYQSISNNTGHHVNYGTNNHTETTIAEVMPIRSNQLQIQIRYASPLMVLE